MTFAFGLVLCAMWGYGIGLVTEKLYVAIPVAALGGFVIMAGVHFLAR